MRTNAIGSLGGQALSAALETAGEKTAGALIEGWERSRVFRWA